jgi:hypothetical protein
MTMKLKLKLKLAEARLRKAALQCVPACPILKTRLTDAINDVIASKSA